MRLYQHYNSGADGDRDIYGNNWGAQTFTPEVDQLIGKLKLMFFRVGAPGTITISIRNTAAGKAVGGDLCSGTIEGVNITDDTDGEWYEITLGGGAELSKDTQYAIVIRAVSGDASNKLSWRADTSEPTYTGGTYCGSTDSGVDWGVYSGVDCMFEEWGVGPPSPTTTTWANLPASQIDMERIEEAIDRKIQDHEDDPNAHIEEGESLYSHKASEIIDHLIRSIVADKIEKGAVWEQHRRSISAWKRLLAMWESEAEKIPQKAWTAEVGDNYCRALAFDGAYVYVGISGPTAKVIKIDPETMATVATWPGIGLYNYVYSLTFDGTYLYAGLNIDPAKVIKIDPETMTTVDTWTGAVGEKSCYALIFDGTYLYAGLNIDPAKVIKIDPETMTTVDTWTAEVGESYAIALTFDGTYLYAGLFIDPAKIIKIDRSTMTTVDTWTGAVGESYAIALTFDGTYIYAGLNIDPAKIIKIEHSGMTTVDTWTGAVGEKSCRSTTFDGTYIYAGLYVSPAKVIKIDRSTMATVSVWTATIGDSNCFGLSFDGNYVYIALYDQPARVIRKIIRDTDETET